MEEKLNELLKKGVFNDVRLSRLGYGTFRKIQAPVVYTKSEELSKEAAVLKKRALSLMESADIRSAKQCQIDAIFCLLQAILAMSQCDISKIVSEYRALANYINEVLAFYNTKDHAKFVASLKYALFNIKFHYLHLEGILMQRSIESAQHFNAKHFLYFLKEYRSLSEIFNESPLVDFILARVDDLEKTMKTKMRIQKKP
eukprot:jgi/Antlo1/1444/2539